MSVQNNLFDLLEGMLKQAYVQAKEKPSVLLPPIGIVVQKHNEVKHYGHSGDPFCPVCWNQLVETNYKQLGPYCIRHEFRCAKCKRSTVILRTPSRTTPGKQDVHIYPGVAVEQ